MSTNDNKANLLPVKPGATKPAISEFYRDHTHRTVGEQYNNLGNITQGSSGIWPGQEAIGWDANGTHAYKAFATVADGIAAQAFLLDRYVRNGDVTFENIISTYAPASDHNDVGSYTAQVAGTVDKIARRLGYSGPAITRNTNLKTAFAQAGGDYILAATIKAMNEVEVGEASDRLAPATTVLAAVKNTYRGRYGSYAGYSRAIGQDPGFRAPNIKKQGIASTENTNHTPNDKDFDKVTDDMFTKLISGIIDVLKGVFGSVASLLGIGGGQSVDYNSVTLPNIAKQSGAGKTPAV